MVRLSRSNASAIHLSWNSRLQPSLGRERRGLITAPLGHHHIGVMLKMRTFKIACLWLWLTPVLSGGIPQMYAIEVSEVMKQFPGISKQALQARYRKKKAKMEVWSAEDVRSR